MGKGNVPRTATKVPDRGQLDDSMKTVNRQWWQSAAVVPCAWGFFVAEEIAKE